MLCLRQLLEHVLCKGAIKAMSSEEKCRAFELDFLRGFALFMMILMHFAYDLRNFFGLDVFRIIEARYFWVFIHPFFIVIFVGISGICCTFSRNNLRRGVKLAGVAVGLSIVTAIATYGFSIDCLIIFNVLHLLAVGILVYTFICFVEKKIGASKEKTEILMVFVGLWTILIGSEIGNYYYGIIEGSYLVPFGICGSNTPFMGDYMPIFPWIGVFLIGAVVGRKYYFSKKTMFGGAPEIVHKISRPFEFMGRHSLIIYLVHQPVLFGLMYAISSVIQRIS